MYDTKSKGLGEGRIVIYWRIIKKIAVYITKSYTAKGMISYSREKIYIVDTIEENEDQYSRNLDKPPTATTNKPNCTRSFTISITYRKGEMIFTGIMNKISKKDGGFSLKIKHVLANVLQRYLLGVLQIVIHVDHIFPFCSDIPQIIFSYFFVPKF